MTERVLNAPIDPINAPVRSNAVDIVKGLAILLVVYEHTGQGMSSRGWWTGPSRSFSDLFVYSFHMPAFFFAAGLFIAGSIQRRGPWGFTLEKMQTILYLYIAWAVLLVAIDPYIAQFKASHSPVHWDNFAISLINGSAGWFFAVLFCCQMLALATRRVPAWLRFVVAAVAASLLPSVGYEVFYKTVWFFSFLAAGMLVGSSISKLSRVPVWAAALVAVGIFSLQVVMVQHFRHAISFGAPSAYLAVVLGLTGIAGLFFIARIIEHTRFGDVWAWIGEASLSIFLMAQFAQGAMRSLLLRIFHTHEFWLQLIVPTLAALLLPAVLWHQQRRWHIGWLFRWPLS
ncbi:MAG: acyltransferase family protein [Acidobacteria bacterium]|nr:acyltransferase family protein [Acidobacteriota bacterium]